jgi:F-type H+-transporting ATPase subunit gamma
MAENAERFHHLELALDHIKKKINGLNNRMNFLRQEEITQEIQTIMLSSEAILNVRS